MLFKTKQLKNDDKDYERLKPIEGKIGKIEIQIENFSYEGLEATIKTKLHNFFDTIGKYPSPAMLSMISGGLIHQFNKLATSGETISRSEYIKQFLDWANFNYEINITKPAKKKLSVELYLKNEMDFSDTINLPKIHINESELENRKQSLINLAEKIKGISLEPKPEPNNSFQPNLERLEEIRSKYVKPKSLKKHASDQENEEANSKSKKSLINFAKETKRFNPEAKPVTIPSLLFDKHAEISDQTKENIISKSKSLLGINLEKENFYVGDLRRKYDFMTGGYSGTTGSDEEVQKGRYINEYRYQLKQLEDIIEYSDYLSSLFFIPLALRNKGEMYDEDIEVIIKFPQHVTIITHENIKIPGDSILNGFTNEESLLHSLLSHKRDHRIEPYASIKVPPLSTSYFNPFPELIGKSAIEKYEDEVVDFKQNIKDLFNAEYYDEKDGVVVQYHFIKLNSDANSAFPSHILVKADSDFEINYEIKSKNLNKSLSGMLYCKLTNFPEK